MADPLINPLTGQPFSSTDSFHGTPSNVPTLASLGDPDEYLSRLMDERMAFSGSFKSFRDAQISKLKGLPEDMQTKARERTPALLQKSAEIQERNLQRYGANVSGATREDFLRRQNLDEARAMTGAVNLAGRQGREIQEAGLMSYLNIAQGVSNSALSTLGEASKRAATRDANYRIQKSQRKAQTYNMLGSLGTAAIMAFAF